MYHRVIDLPQDPNDITVTPRQFAEQIEYIKQACTPMRLADLVYGLEKDDLPKRAIAITFDDGYIDNLENAYPLLREKKIPATVFVPSDSIGSSQEFWWDELERVFLLPEEVPDQLMLVINGLDHKWNIASKEERILAHAELRSILKPMQKSDLLRVLEDITTWSGAGREGRRDYRTMNIDELLFLTEDGLIELGAHTATHPQLSSLPEDMQRIEITKGRERLEAAIGASVETFAYPYGKQADFTYKTAEIVKTAGFRLAVTTITGSVERGDDPFWLKRCGVHAWDIETFQKNLEEFFIQ